MNASYRYSPKRPTFFKSDLYLKDDFIIVFYHIVLYYNKPPQVNYCYQHCM